MNPEQTIEVFTAKDLETDQEVRWCPGCGDYAILNSLKKVLPDLGVKRSDMVFVSGIGCSSRLPYYLNTYGMHSIHGRATSIATGLKVSRPELSVWVITGDGDALSIGGNHLIHTLRRNPDINILLFNNQIYGLTKGQFSPTSELGKVTKSSPMGTVDQPFNPLALALGANASFIARTIDRDPKHQQEIYKRAHAHKGCSLVEIYQNCNVFNDGAFETLTDKSTKASNTLLLEHGKPLVFNEGKQGIALRNGVAELLDLTNQENIELWIHDENDPIKAYILSRFFEQAEFPTPLGVIYVRSEQATLNDLVQAQLSHSNTAEKTAQFNTLLKGNKSWEVQ
jgi:2-oxoglutarate ferredoxin oxidoreductase subunit beta